MKYLSTYEALKNTQSINDFVIGKTFNETNLFISLFSLYDPDIYCVHISVNDDSSNSVVKGKKNKKEATIFEHYTHFQGRKIARIAVYSLQNESIAIIIDPISDDSYNNLIVDYLKDVLPCDNIASNSSGIVVTLLKEDQTPKLLSNINCEYFKKHTHFKRFDL